MTVDRRANHWLQSGEMLGTVTRAGRALELFTPERPTWGATAVSRELEIAKSQAHELLTSLTEIGLLRRVPGGRYRLGWRTLALGRNGLRCEFPDDALRLMRAFAMHYREPVQLVALDRDRLAVVAQYSTRSATDDLVPSVLSPACAFGRCLLADLPDDDAVAILRGPDPVRARARAPGPARVRPRGDAIPSCGRSPCRSSTATATRSRPSASGPPRRGGSGSGRS